jgi:hypothetical protein
VSNAKDRHSPNKASLPGGGVRRYADFSYTCSRPSG